MVVIVKVPTARIVEDWARGKQAPVPRAEQWLRCTYDVVRTLRAWDAPDTIRSWFVGMNPLLADTSPALLVAKDTAAVLEAAHGLIAMLASAPRAPDFGSRRYSRSAFVMASTHLA